MKYRNPTLWEYLVLKNSEDYSQLYFVAESIAGSDNIEEFQRYQADYIAEIEARKDRDPQLKTPYYMEYSEEKQYYSCNSSDMKLVSDYTRLNFNEIFKLDIFLYWSWLHDAVVYLCSKTDEGKDYLEMCWCMSQTEPDEDAWDNFAN